MKILKSNRRLSLALLTASFTVGHLYAQTGSTTDDESIYYEDISSAQSVSDPFETLNRFTFQFNDFFYLNLVQPIAAGYTFITPDSVDEGAKNFFRNLRYPVRLAGNLLQGRWEGAWVETKRFAVNTTAGIAGIMSPADKLQGLAPIPSEDIGQALATLGIGEGPYLVIPFLGPSNMRDIFGMIGDAAVQPYKRPLRSLNNLDWEVRLARSSMEFVVATPALMDAYLNVKRSAIDPYSSVKRAYAERRRAVILK